MEENRLIVLEADRAEKTEGRRNRERVGLAQDTMADRIEGKDLVFGQERVLSANV